MLVSLLRTPGSNILPIQRQSKVNIWHGSSLEDSKCLYFTVSEKWVKHLNQALRALIARCSG